MMHDDLSGNRMTNDTNIETVVEFDATPTRCKNADSSTVHDQMSGNQLCRQDEDTRTYPQKSLTGPDRNMFES